MKKEMVPPLAVAAADAVVDDFGADAALGGTLAPGRSIKRVCAYSLIIAIGTIYDQLERCEHVGNYYIAAPSSSFIAPDVFLQCPSEDAVATAGRIRDEWETHFKGWGEKMTHHTSR